MYELMVSADFSAAHKLVKYNGKCSRLHGHNWKVEVILKTKKLNFDEMIMDARKVKKILREFLESIDHYYLNELPYFKKKEPTSENIACFIFKGLDGKLPYLGKVRVWESDKVSASYEK